MLFRCRLPLGLVCLFTLACGTNTQTNKVKSYVLTVVQGDTSFVSDFKSLIAQYNAQAGKQVLSYTDDRAAANSAIVVTKGLKASTAGKVGLGQWLSETRTEGASLPGQTTHQTVNYAMRVEFDWDFFNDRRESTEANLYDKQKLFFHECGHGLEMDHVTDPSDMMYPDIAGQKNLPAYFDRVRTYMADQ